MTQPATDARLGRLESRLIDYHGQDMSAVIDMLDYLREDGDTVIAGGSLSIDQGNGESDLDMVIVGPANTTSAVPFEHWVGTLRIDAWSRNQTDVDALFEQAETALASDGPLLHAFGNAVQEQQLKLLHRIAFGVVVEGDAVRPSTARSARDVALDLLTREYAERSRESAMVAGLALAAGRELAAATLARVAAEEALHSVLHGRGEPFSGDKWLAEQLAGSDDLVALHEEVAVLPPRGAPLAPFTRRALSIAAELLALDLSPAVLGPGLSWSHEALTLLPLAGGHVLVSTEHNTGWKLEPEEAEAWTALVASGTTADDGRSGSFPHPTEAPAQADLCVTLYEQGVLGLTWHAGLPLSSLATHGGSR